MIRTGRVLSSEIGANKDGDTSVRMLTVELSDGDDIQTVEYYDDGGTDYRPPDGAEVVVIDVSPSHRVAIAVDDLLTPTVNEGEKEIYSTDTAGTSKAATILLKNDGTIEILDNTDFAVRYSDLETAFNELKSDFNTFIGVFNAHIHPDPVSGNTGAPTTTGSTSTADITGAKIDEIKVPA